MSTQSKMLAIAWSKSGENRNGVKKRMWDKWGPLARRTFNGLYEDMESQSAHNSAPDSPTLNDKHWDVIRWNAAFVAAVVVNELEITRPIMDPAHKGSGFTPSVKTGRKE